MDSDHRVNNTHLVNVNNTVDVDCNNRNNNRISDNNQQQGGSSVSSQQQGLRSADNNNTRKLSGEVVNALDERHPERLMRSHHGSHPAAANSKDMDTIGGVAAHDQYSKSGGGGVSPGSRSRHSSPGDIACDYPLGTDADPRLSDQTNRQHLDPSSAAQKSARTRRKLESMLRNDSLSSDPSDCVRPPPPKPHKHKKGKKQRQASLSSSDDEIQTTPECTSCDEGEIESESVSEKGTSYVFGFIM